jgi:hypothetical protein
MTLSLSGYEAYFDASRDGDNKQIVVAGYVSTVEEWEQFEIAWRLTLAKYDLPYFHMREFTASQKAFKHSKWKSEIYRAGFLSDLALIIRSWTAASVACAMKQALFDRYNETYDLGGRFNPYSICGRDCAAQVRAYIRKDVKSELPITYILDQGDEGRGFLMKEMEASGLPPPVFKRSRPYPKHPELDKSDPPRVQLQACDLSAWELRRGDEDIVKGKKGIELRKSLHALSDMKRIWKETKEPDLKGLIQVAGIKERSRS